MSVERVMKIQRKVNKRTGDVTVSMVPEVIWHMPDDLPDDLPEASTMDTDACLRMIGAVYHGIFESLISLYQIRRRGGIKNEIEMGNVKRLIRKLERELRDPFYDIPVEGEALLEKAREEVYGKKWRDHIHFAAERRKKKAP